MMIFVAWLLAEVLSNSPNKIMLTIIFSLDRIWNCRRTILSSGKFEIETFISLEKKKEDSFQEFKRKWSEGDFASGK